MLIFTLNVSIGTRILLSLDHENKKEIITDSELVINENQNITLKYKENEYFLKDIKLTVFSGQVYTFSAKYNNLNLYFYIYSGL